MTGKRSAARTITLYPWFKFGQNLIFWQAIWFLYFQQELSGAEAILLYAIYDIGTTVMEIPSGYMSDRIGRRFTLIASSIMGVVAMTLLATGDSFAMFALGQIAMGASMALASGTDSSILYESLIAEGRTAEVEAQELRAWRFGFVALAVSAVIGGAMATLDPVLPFVATGVAFAALIGLTALFSEPPKAQEAPDLSETRAALRAALTQPVLTWLLALSVLMYGFSHLPFIFGQPFILEVLEPMGLASEAPMVSGAISAAMMLTSVAVSLVAMRLRKAMGLAAVLLMAFAMQIGLAFALTLSGSVVLIGLLVLRMVPDSLSKPFIQARIQPLVQSETRATYLSIQSFAARILFAGSLALAAGGASAASALPLSDIQAILRWYAGIGAVCLGALALWVRFIPLEPSRD